MKRLISYRPYIQLFFALVFFYAIFHAQVSLALIALVATVLGGLLGKTFCKWMCPMGLIMEFMQRSMSDDQKRHHMYNYYKLGCPISWIQGFLNPYSFFKIKNDKAACIACGKCDRACYIVSLNQEMSLYKSDKKEAQAAFNCSKCLSCVASCPTGSLSIRR